MVKIEDIKFEDAILSIPKNSVEIEFKAKVFKNGEIVTLSGIYDLENIQEAKRLFDKCCDGEYPTYIVSEEFNYDK